MTEWISKKGEGFITYHKKCSFHLEYVCTSNCTLQQYAHDIIQRNYNLSDQYYENKHRKLATFGSAYPSRQETFSILRI
jgi:hypothetical protein